MGRGEKARKRVLNALKAKFEKTNKLPVLSSQIKKNNDKKNSSKRDEIPASLKKMMALKAAASGGGGRSKSTLGNAAVPPRQKQGTDRIENADPSTSGRNDGDVSDQQPVAVKQQPKQQVQRTQAVGPSQTQGKGLKQRKKDFLKKKKLKKKGKGSLDDEDERSDKEAEFLDQAMATAPKFGEQAHQPIQVNLKRKHWNKKEKSAAERCKDVFLKQMSNAARQAGGFTSGHGALQARSSKKKGVKAEEKSRLDVIEAYRQSKRRAPEDGAGSEPVATLQSLAALVKKNAAETS